MCYPLWAAGVELPKGMIALSEEVAPDFQLTDNNGGSIRLSELKGHWLFVHFWASWCGPCREELPKIEKLIASFHNKPLKFVLINTAETDDTVFEFLGTLSIDVQTFMDRDGQVTEQWKPRGLPTTILVDPHGQKRFLVMGGRPWDTPAYRGFLDRLVQPTH